MSNRASHFFSIILLVFILTPSLKSESQDWQPERWKQYAQRPALMPKMEMDADKHYWIMTSNGDFRCNGSWRSSAAVKAKKYYKFHAEYLSVNIKLPRRSILASVDWFNTAKQRVSQPEFPACMGRSSDGWTLIEAVFPAPNGAVSAITDLIFRWSEKGTVRWRNVSLLEAEPPKNRTVNVATINFRPQSSSGPEKNLQLFSVYLKQAGEKKADIVCLPEGITVVGTPKSYLDVAEAVPGPSTRFLGEPAKQYTMYIIAGLYERVGETVYNTSVLIDRKGDLVGTYRKAALPREEIEGGITPGDDFPVYETDFGKVGMMICWDVQFVEPARRLAKNGAEIIFLPIWGGTEPLFAARAIENQVYLVTSSYDAPTAIWNREGNIISNAPKNGSIAFSAINLNERTLWPWLGDLRSRISREAPPVRE